MKLCLIDGSGYIWRAYHALPPLTRADGTPIGAVLGYAKMLARLLRETDADHIAVMFDHGRRSFRHRIYERYKANRPPPPADLVAQFPLVRQVTATIGVRAIELAGYEADDLIATYARHAVREDGATVTIVSSDKDLMQLVDDDIVMLDPLKRRLIGPDEVRAKFGVRPDQVPDVQALCGDAVDNVPGVPGIGIKTAAALVAAYGSLENVLAHVADLPRPSTRDALRTFADQARFSRRLVMLDDGAPMPVPLDAMGVPGAIDIKAILASIAVPARGAPKFVVVDRQIDRPTSGWWALRLGKGTVEVAARIWIHQTTHEPEEPQNVMDRSPILSAEINGGLVSLDEVWLRRGRTITPAHYRFLVADRAWARAHMPHSPEANPTQKIDLAALPSPF